MVITQKQTIKIKAGKQHIVWDYPMTNKNIGISYQEINGKSPDNGWWKNSVCEEWYYVMGGKGKALIENKSHDFSSGDIIVLPKMKKHKIIGKKLKLLAITTPDWYYEQSEIIPDK